MFTFRSLVRTTTKENARSDNPRRVVDATVVVEYNGKQQRCLLRDVSPKGAGLVVSGELDLPNNFNMKIDGRIVTAQVVWRRRNRIGVRLGADRLSGVGKVFTRLRG